MTGMLPDDERAAIKAAIETTFDTSVHITRPTDPATDPASDDPYGSYTGGGSEQTIAPVGTLVRIGPASLAQLTILGSEVGAFVAIHVTYSEDLPTPLKSGDPLVLDTTGERWLIHSVDTVQSPTFSFTNSALAITRR